MAHLALIERLAERLRENNLPTAPPWIAGPRLELPTEIDPAEMPDMHTSGQLRHIAQSGRFTEPLNHLLMQVAELLDDSHQAWLEEMAAKLRIQVDLDLLQHFGSTTQRTRSVDFMRPVTVTPRVDPTNVINRSRDNVSEEPVTTARYIVEIVMNEEDPCGTPEVFRSRLERSLQESLDAGHLEDIRYDTIMFAVIDRQVLDVAPANHPKEPDAGAGTGA